MHCQEVWIWCFMAMLRIIISLGFEKWNRSRKLETLEEVSVKLL